MAYSPLRRLRFQKGMTLGQMAAQLGLDVSTVGLWERGLRRPHPANIRRYAIALGITVDELLNLLDPPPAENVQPAA